MIRFAIWAAVSTIEQAAEDKDSLAIQERKCRAAGVSRGWEEAGLYIVPGHSRTRYVNLRDAEAAMPPLKQMLDDAQAHKFDILILYDFNRLRDLLDPVSKSLRHYGVQMLSLGQTVEPVDPGVYNPYKNDATIYMQNMSKMGSDIAMNDLRRKYFDKMPVRASERGLPPGKPPYGYQRAPDRKTAPEIDPIQAAHVLTIKDMFFAGQSTYQIAEYLDGVTPPPDGGRRWYPKIVQHILCNPFYAGITRWGASRSELDPRTGKTKRNYHIDPSQIATGPGRHVPLWDAATHAAILAEFRRRRKTYRGRMARTLTGLLTCGVCRARMWAYYNHGIPDLAHLVWRCSAQRTHIGIANQTIMRRLHEEMVNYLTNPQATSQTGDPDAARRGQENELAALRDQVDRLNAAYAAGAFTLDELTRQKPPLALRIQALEKALQDQDGQGADTLARENLLSRFRENVDLLAPLLAGPSQEANHFLHTILQDITIDGDGRPTITWK